MKRVLLLSVVLLAACLEQVATPQAPDVPVAPAGSIAVPSAPDSASNIMRISDIDFASYSRDMAKWVKLEIGESMNTATPKIESYFSPQGSSLEERIEYVESSGTKTETEFSTFGAEGGKVTLVERVNIKDDSISAEQFYAIFKADGGDYMLANYGMKIKCRRGANTTNWQTALCP